MNQTVHRLSVVIVNYGPVSVVQSCLESLIDDWQSGLIEVIVVDNASPAFSAQELRRHFPWVRVLVNSENRGFAAGCNTGIGEASGDYILLLNPDTIVRPGTLRTMLDYVERNPDVGATTCRVILENGQLDPACHRGFPTPWASLTYVLGLAKLAPHCRLFGGYHLTWLPRDQVHEIDSPSGCFFLVRRAVVKAVGPLDEQFFLYGEDIDWAMRIRQAGWKITYNPKAEIVHRKGVCSGIKKTSAKVSSSSRTERLRAYHAFHEAMRIFYRKHYQSRYPGFVRWLVMAAISLKERLGRRKLTV